MAEKPEKSQNKKKKEKVQKMTLDQFQSSDINIDWAEELETNLPLKTATDRLSSRGHGGGSDDLVLPSAPRGMTEMTYDFDAIPHTGPFFLVLNNAPFEATEDQIAQFFKPVPLKSINLRPEFGSQQKKAPPQVEFETREILIRALKEKYDAYMDRRRIELKTPAQMAAAFQGKGSYGNRRDQGSDGRRDSGPDLFGVNWRDAAQAQQLAAPPSFNLERAPVGGFERRLSDPRQDPRDGGRSQPPLSRGDVRIERAPVLPHVSAGDDRRPSPRMDERREDHRRDGRDVQIVRGPIAPLDEGRNQFYRSDSRDDGPPSRGSYTSSRGGFDRQTSYGSMHGGDRDRNGPYGPDFERRSHGGPDDRYGSSRGAQNYEERDSRRSYNPAPPSRPGPGGPFGERPVHSQPLPPPQEFIRQPSRGAERPHVEPEPQQQERRKPLTLQPRTIPLEASVPVPAGSSAAIFGGAKPVDTTAREREVEEKLLKDREALDLAKKRALEATATTVPVMPVQILTRPTPPVPAKVAEITHKTSALAISGEKPIDQRPVASVPPHRKEPSILEPTDVRLQQRGVPLHHEKPGGGHFPHRQQYSSYGTNNVEPVKEPHVEPNVFNVLQHFNDDGEEQQMSVKSEEPKSPLNKDPQEQLSHRDENNRNGDEDDDENAGSETSGGGFQTVGPRKSRVFSRGGGGNSSQPRGAGGRGGGPGARPPQRQDESNRPRGGGQAPPTRRPYNNANEQKAYGNGNGGAGEWRGSGANSDSRGSSNGGQRSSYRGDGGRGQMNAPRGTVRSNSNSQQ